MISIHLSFFFVVSCDLASCKDDFIRVHSNTKNREELYSYQTDNLLTEKCILKIFKAWINELKNNTIFFFRFCSCILHSTILHYSPSFCFPSPATPLGLTKRINSRREMKSYRSGQGRQEPVRAPGFAPKGASILGPRPPMHFKTLHTLFLAGQRGPGPLVTTMVTPLSMVLGLATWNTPSRSHDKLLWWATSQRNRTYHLTSSLWPV